MVNDILWYYCNSRSCQWRISLY